MSNSISFVGKLGRDSERKPTQNGNILKFSVGENVGWGDRKTTNWWNCTVFGRQAESNLMDYLVKGASVFIIGEVSFSEHEGKTYNNVAVKTVELVGSRPQQQDVKAPQYGNRQGGGYGQNNTANNNRPDLDDSLPF